MSTLNAQNGLVIKFKEGVPVQRLRFENIESMVNYLIDVNGYIEYALGRDILLCGADTSKFHQIKSLFEKRLNEIPANVNIHYHEKVSPDMESCKNYYVINIPWFLDKVKDLDK